MYEALGEAGDGYGRPAAHPEGLKLAARPNILPFMFLSNTLGRRAANDGLLMRKRRGVAPEQVARVCCEMGDAKRMPVT
jgi:hypothetical protein